MHLFIRPFTLDDLPQVHAIFNAVFQETPSSLAALQSRFEHYQSSSRFFYQWITQYDENIVAYGEAQGDQQRQSKLIICVHPNYEGIGIGSALYNTMLPLLRFYNCLSVQALARESKRRSVQFLQVRGFQEKQRDWTLYLDVAAFDPAPYAGVEAQLQSQGIEIKTLIALASDPDYTNKLYRLYHELIQQVPSREPSQPLSYDGFMNILLKSTDLLPEAYFIAQHMGKYIGMNTLYTRLEANYLFNEFTGVNREYRRKSIALALKLRGIAYAKAHGYSLVKTSNNSSNTPILRLNEQLGFIKEPALISFMKVL